MNMNIWYNPLNIQNTTSLIIDIFFKKIREGVINSTLQVALTQRGPIKTSLLTLPVAPILWSPIITLVSNPAW